MRHPCLYFSRRGYFAFDRDCEFQLDYKGANKLHEIKLALALLTVLVQLPRCIKFMLQDHSSLPVIRTLHVSTQLAAVIRCRFVNCCPALTLLHFAF
jgi:hypothetical protein